MPLVGELAGRDNFFCRFFGINAAAAIRMYLAEDRQPP